MRRRGGLRTAPTTNECLQCFFTHPVLFTQRIDGIPTSFSVPTSCQRRLESSPSAHGAIMISAPGIFLLYQSYVQGSFLSSLPRLPFLDSRLRMNDDVESMTSLLEYRWCLNNVVAGVFRLCATAVRVRLCRKNSSMMALHWNASVCATGGLPKDPLDPLPEVQAGPRNSP